MRYLPSKAMLMAAVAFTTNSHAASVSGEISFIKKPPYAGIIYITSGSNEVTAPAEIDQQNKKFTKRVIPASKGQTVTFKNSDNVDHNIFANDRATGVNFDVGLMPSGGSSSIDVSWDQPGLVRIGCKIHPKMRAYIANIPSNDYVSFDFRQTTPPYTFKLDNIPDDAQKVVFQLPSYEPIELDLKSNSSVSLPIKKKGKDKGTITIKTTE